MVLKLFKRKSKKKQLQDLDGLPLFPGDKVDCLRYEMGESVLIDGENGFEYESIATKQKVNYTKMIDAATSFQKVRKLS